MRDNIDNAVTKCLEELGFKAPNRIGQDAKPSIGGDYVIMEVYLKNRHGVVVSRHTTGYKESSKGTDGIYLFSKILKEAILFKVGDDEAGLTIFPERKDEKPVPQSNLEQLDTDLKNIFRNIWPTSDIGDYLRTAEYRLRKYAQPIVSQGHNAKPAAYGASN